MIDALVDNQPDDPGGDGDHVDHNCAGDDDDDDSDYDISDDYNAYLF